MLDERERKLFLISLPKEATAEMVREYFIKYGEIEDLRVIVDKKKVNFKKYGFVLFKKGSSLNQVLEESLTHTIAPGVSVDCKQTLLREELKEKQLEID